MKGALLRSDEALVTSSLGPYGSVIRPSWECHKALVANKLIIIAFPLGSFAHLTLFSFPKKKKKSA